jgi:hypothetical protein
MQKASMLMREWSICNRQIEYLIGATFKPNVEQDFYERISKSDATILAAIGVIEHLRDPHLLFDAFRKSGIEYLFFSVPMMSLSVMLENCFTSIFPRQLSGAHTHLFTEQSLKWMYLNRHLEPLAEWRFGIDIMDLYRTINVLLYEHGVSQKVLDMFINGFAER